MSREFRYADLDRSALRKHFSDAGSLTVVLSERQVDYANYLLDQAETLNRRISLLSGMWSFVTFLRSIGISWNGHRNWPKLAELQTFYLEVMPENTVREVRGTETAYIFQRK